MAYHLSDERLDWHLWNWQQWHEGLGVYYSGEIYSNADGYSSRASGGVGGTSSRLFDAMVATEDTRCAQIVDTIIDELLPGEKSAVYHVHIGSAWRPGLFPHKTVLELYESGRERVRRGLERRAVE